MKLSALVGGRNRVIGLQLRLSQSGNGVLGGLVKLISGTFGIGTALSWQVAVASEGFSVRMRSRLGLCESLGDGRCSALDLVAVLAR